MELVTFYLMLVIISVSSTASAQEGTCNACNCQFNNVEVLIQLIKSEIATARINESVSGVTYIRWGRISCPSSTGAQLVYAGRAGGTDINFQGGAAETICLPDNPDYLEGTAGQGTTSAVSGVEYEFHSGGPLSNIDEHNAPCSVCHVSTRATTIMVPAKTTCPSSWTREYYGYLTTAHTNHHRSSYICLDMNPEVVAGTSTHTDPALLYFAYTDCNGLSCPPYENRRALSCAVCTK